MRYFLLIADGMADAPISRLDGNTPLAAADTRCMDALAGAGRVGLVRTVPPGCPPGSDTGILTLLGYDPRRYLTGRSALEAVGCGIPLRPGEAACRCNLVTISGGVLRSYSAGELSRADTGALLDALRRDPDFAALAAALGIRLFPASPFRLMCVGPASLLDGVKTTPPHEIVGQAVAPYLPAGPGGAALLSLMEKARRVLSAARPNRGRPLPATDLWPWAPGQAMGLPAFSGLYGKEGALISATPLVRGIGILAGLSTLCPSGATGDAHTDYGAKAAAAIACFEAGRELVAVHVEAPDSCSHSRDLPGKLRAIESIDRRLLAPVSAWLESSGQAFRILVLPDHGTHTATGCHDAAPVPWLLYDSQAPGSSGLPYSETAAGQSGVFYEDGTRLLSDFLS